MYIDFKMPMFFATVCQLMCVCLCVAAGNITQEDQPRAESAMKRLIDAFGLTQQSCMTAYMALLKCVAFNVQEAYNKMLEGEPLSLSLKAAYLKKVFQTHCWDTSLLKSSNDST